MRHWVSRLAILYRYNHCIPPSFLTYFSPYLTLFLPPFFDFHPLSSNDRSFAKDDYVILKLDVEGSEYGILQGLVSSGAIRLIDKLYGEIHEWAPNGASKQQWNRLKSLLARNNVRMFSWEADR